MRTLKTKPNFLMKISLFFIFCMIGGQIMKLTGMVDARTLEKFEREAKEQNRESWYRSWV